MKGTRNFLISTTLGFVMGWALGYLRLPSLGQDHSFWVGFVTSLAFVFFLISLLFVWNKNTVLIRLIGRTPSTSNTATEVRTYPLLWITISLFILSGGMASSFMIYNQNEVLDTQTNYYNKKIKEQSELIESIRKGNLVFLMGNILNKVDDELRDNPNRTLTDGLIKRIVALSYSLKPYRYFEGDSLSTKKLSPERGQLLLALAAIEMDSSSFDKIKLSTTFANADLIGADLSGVNLNSVDLVAADLKDANLMGVCLDGANLTDCNLWGANLKRANLKRANLKRANLKWANLSESDLTSANLNGTDLTNVNLKKADLGAATIQWAKMEGVLLYQANLVDCDMFGANLTRANLTKANLSGVFFVNAILKETILLESEWSRAIVEENWFEKLNSNQVIGSKEIIENYKVVNDTSDRQKNYKFCLEKNED